MMRRVSGRIVLPVGLGLGLVWMVLAGLGAVRAAQAGAVEGISRPGAPVVLNGDAFPAFAGVPLDDLVLYAYDGGWTPIPFQVDEVTVTGTYTGYEDGQLDADDQLVFMAADAGVSNGTWPDDFPAQVHPRYAITITDPLSPAGQGVAYLYHSATLTRTADGYVSWDEATQTVTALSYTAGFETEQFVGLESLTLHGTDVDVLDRQKLRGQVTGYLGPVPIFTESFNEETVLDFVTVTMTVTLPITGPVRAVGGSEAQGFAFYGSRAQFGLSLDLSDVMSSGIRIHIDYVGVSLDLNDPAGNGMAPTRYYDGNGTDVAVDGVPDAVPGTVPPWAQIDGALGGWVTVGAVDPAGGTATQTYKDDDTVDPADTGDGQSFADTGVRIDDPNGVVTVTQTLFVLPAGAGNSGATYQQYANNPLVTDTAGQTYQPGFTVYLPTVLKD